MRVIISGTTGLIGGRVHKDLSEKHDTVTIGRKPTCDLKVDFSDPKSVAGLSLSSAALKAEALVHCAGVVNEDFQKDPMKAYIQNTVSLSYLLQKVVEQGIKYFVYFSTAHVYGALKGKISEETPVNPLSDYALAHHSAEQIIRRFAQEKQLTALILRPLAVFGLPMDMQSFARWFLIPYSFPLEAVYKHVITLKSNGLQNRNFISTEDLSGYVCAFLENPSVFDPFTVVNTAGPDNMSVFDFAKKCAETFKRISGQPCEVTVPFVPGGNEGKEGNRREEGDDFVLQTKKNFYESKRKVGPFLEEFIKVIIKDYDKGKKYG